jgi:hypothetical protein
LSDQTAGEPRQLKEHWKLSRKSTGESKVPTSSKYDPLNRYLEQLPSDRDDVRLTFAEIEKILGHTLPNSAYEYRAWWGNQSDYSARPQAAAWMTAGFRANPEHTIAERRVLFARF